jgi:hypothetical protein
MLKKEDYMFSSSEGSALFDVCVCRSMKMMYPVGQGWHIFLLLVPDLY